MPDQLTLALSEPTGTYEAKIDAFYARAKSAGLPELSLDHTLSEHQDRWHRLIAICREVLAPIEPELHALRLEVKNVATTPSKRRSLHHQIRDLQAAQRHLYGVAERLWLADFQRLRDEIEAEHGLSADASDDGDAGWFYNTISNDRAGEVFGNCTLRELLEIAKEG